MNLSFEAVFIADLHLHPQMPAIDARFEQFIRWAARHTQSIYILGDFLHVWPGDDSLDTWSSRIAARLAWLSSKGISLYFLPGNRDFLIGADFLRRAKMQRLDEPAVIQLGGERILLAHGDRYCTADRAHQWLRPITRNRYFYRFFLRIPYAWRRWLVTRVRAHSEENRRKSLTQMQIVASVMLVELDGFHSTHVIHGHIHQPGLTAHSIDGRIYQQYVLSDWDANPQVLCYNRTSGFKFIQF